MNPLTKLIACLYSKTVRVDRAFKTSASHPFFHLASAAVKIKTKLNIV